MNNTNNPTAPGQPPGGGFGFQAPLQAPQQGGALPGSGYPPGFPQQQMAPPPGQGFQAPPGQGFPPQQQFQGAPQQQFQGAPQQQFQGAPQQQFQGAPQQQFQGAPQLPQGFQGAPQLPQGFQGAPQGQGQWQPQGFQGYPQGPQGPQGFGQQAQKPPQEQVLASMLRGFAQASIGKGGNYVVPGEYIFRVTEVKYDFAGQGGYPFFVVGLDVLMSTAEMSPPGDHRDWMVSYKDPRYWSTYQGDVKQFLLAGKRGDVQRRGGDPRTVHDAHIDDSCFQQATSPAQPWVGVVVRASAFLKPKKDKNAEPFTKVNYQWVDQTQYPG